MAIDWVPLKSSNVEAAALDEDGALLIRYRSGGEYKYDSAGEAELQDLTTSPSPGSYVARNLRRLPARRIS